MTQMPECYADADGVTMRLVDPTPENFAAIRRIAADNEAAARRRRLAFEVPGTLIRGTVTDHGTIARSSLTAYQMTDGTWVPFGRIHAMPAVSPLVVLG